MAYRRRYRSRFSRFRSRFSSGRSRFRRRGYPRRRSYGRSRISGVRF